MQNETFTLTDFCLDGVEKREVKSAKRDFGSGFTKKRSMFGQFTLGFGFRKSVCGSKKDQAASDVWREVSLENDRVVKNLTVLKLEM